MGCIGSIYIFWQVVKISNCHQLFFSRQAKNSMSLQVHVFPPALKTQIGESSSGNGGSGGCANTIGLCCGCCTFAWHFC